MGIRPFARSMLIAIALVQIGCVKSRTDQTETGEDTPSRAAPSAREATRPDTTIIVNGLKLSEEVVGQLQQLYPVTIPPGRYWYDAVSGGYGREGEPIAGQMMAGPRARWSSRGERVSRYLRRLHQRTPDHRGREGVHRTAVPNPSRNRPLLGHGHGSGRIRGPAALLQPGAMSRRAPTGRWRPIDVSHLLRPQWRLHDVRYPRNDHYRAAMMAVLSTLAFATISSAAQQGVTPRSAVPVEPIAAS